MYLNIEEESLIRECLLTEFYGLLNRFSLVQSFQLFVSLPENSSRTQIHCHIICTYITVWRSVVLYTYLVNFFLNSRCILMHGWKKSFNTTWNEETLLGGCIIVLLLFLLLYSNCIIVAVLEMLVALFPDQLSITVWE